MRGRSRGDDMFTFVNSVEKVDEHECTVEWSCDVTKDDGAFAPTDNPVDPKSSC